MARPAVTYYHDVMRRNYRDIEVHKSGAEASRHFKANAPNYFQLPINWKKDPVLTKGQSLRAGYPLRSYQARFLDKDEIEIYNEYGDDAWFDFNKGKLCEPQEEEIAN